MGPRSSHVVRERGIGDGCDGWRGGGGLRSAGWGDVGGGGGGGEKVSVGSRVFVFIHLFFFLS